MERILENDSSSSTSTDIDLELCSYGLRNYSAVSPFSVNTNASSDENRTKVATRKRNGQERLPTRRPDPKVYNRNALLARENRRKKKLYLERLEQELQEARIANKALTKALKQQLSLTRQLEQQKKYYQNIIGNRAEISRLFSILSNNSKSTEESDSSYIVRNPTDEMSNDDLYGIENDLDDCGSFASSTSWDNIWDRNCQSTDEALAPIEDLNVFNDDCYLASSSDIQSSPEFSAPPTDFRWDEDIGAIAAQRGSCLYINCGPCIALDASDNPVIVGRSTCAYNKQVASVN